MTNKRFPERRARTTRNGRLVFRGHEKASDTGGVNFWRVVVDARATKRGVAPEVIIEESIEAVNEFARLATAKSKTLGNVLVAMMLGGYLKNVNDGMLADVAEGPNKAQFTADFYGSIAFIAAGLVEAEEKEK
jgi:hypothetical protein